MDIENKYLKYKVKYLEFKNNQEGGEEFSYSKVYVFNKLNNIIDRIPYKIFDNKIHVIMDDIMLEKVSKKNNMKIRKYISYISNYKKKFFHVSIKLFENIENKDTYEKSWLGEGIYKNPQGLWFSCGLSWQDFIGSKPNKWSLSTYIYEIIPSNTILHISSVDELKIFINKYKKDKIKIYDIIDWKKVKSEYDGLLISPYLGDKIWGKNAVSFSVRGNYKKLDEYYNKILGDKWKSNIYFLAEWYRHWENATGVIWKKSGLTNIKLLTKLNTFDNIV